MKRERRARAATPSTRLLQVLLAVAFGTVLSVVLLTGAEVLMRVFDLGPAPQRDALAGFADGVPMFEPFEPAVGPAVYRAENSRPGDRREFLQQKPGNGLRVFVVGGSSAAGVPYGRDYSFSGWLERRLSDRLPAHHVEVVNAAVSGYGSRRVLGVVREIARYEPDLLIVYAGHNESSERQFYAHLLGMDPRLFELWTAAASTRVFALAQTLLGMRAPPSFSTETDDDAGLEAVNRPGQMFAKRQNVDASREVDIPRARAYAQIHFEANLREIAHTMRDAGATVLFVSQTQNYADWRPGASLHDASLSPAQRAEFDALLTEGDGTDCASRLVSLRRAEEIDPGHAELHFEIATCYRLLGDYAQARTHYLLASDLDGIPVGAPSSYKRVIEDVSVATGSLYLDVEPAIHEAAERISNGLVGYDFVIDAMHPTLRAHQLIALAIVERLRAADSLLGDAAWREEAAAFPTPEEILRREPGLAYQERLVRGLSCLLLEWNDCAQAEARAVLAVDSANAGAKRLLALARRQAEQPAANPPARSR